MKWCLAPQAAIAEQGK